MEPVIKGVVLPIIDSIIPVENIPLQELPEYYNALAVKAKDIYNLWEQALQNSAVVENAFEENLQGDENFAETFEGALNVAAREIEFLNGENIHLKNQKLEIIKAADENAKSAQERINELEKVVALQKEMIAIHEKAITTFETVTQEIANNPMIYYGSYYGGLNNGGSNSRDIFFRSTYYNFDVPRWNILKNQIEETRLHQLELLKK